MKTKKEIEDMIETMRDVGSKSKNDIERQILCEKMGVLTWVLKEETKQ